VFYGQRHAVQELGAAVMVTNHYDVPFEVVRLPETLLVGSALTGGGSVPEGHYADPSMRATVVPNRNMILLSIAGGVAIREGFDAVAYAAHSGDHAIYPDCRTTFIDAMEDALARCDYRRINLLTPFAGRTKAGIVKMGAELKAPLELTYSCYNGGEHHCGKCGTCIERREAFAFAGVPDPTDYGGAD
jgi:7-cyano-7-deazaguanine synthase